MLFPSRCAYIFQYLVLTIQDLMLEYILKDHVTDAENSALPSKE